MNTGCAIQDLASKLRDQSMHFARWRSLPLQSLRTVFMGPRLRGDDAGAQLPASACDSGMNMSFQSAGSFFTVPTLCMNST